MQTYWLNGYGESYARRKEMQRKITNASAKDRMSIYAVDKPEAGYSSLRTDLE